MTCPFCDSPDVEEVSAWGGQLITRQLRCRACASYFEAIRDDPAARAEAIRDDFVTPAEPPASPPPRAA